MLFDSSKHETLCQTLFENPTKEYRATPFWGWDGDLKPQELCRQIEIFKKMGFGGFHMHARAGLVTPYLSDEFMRCVRACCEKAEQEDMLAWLYDEDRYPSGPAGGIVTADPAFTRRYVRVTPYANGDRRAKQAQRGYERAQDSRLLAVYDIVLDENGFLKSAVRLTHPQEAQGQAWYAYFECCPASQGAEQSYVDTLNPRAIDQFARVTYDRYREAVGDYFGTVCPAMFTDEPQYPANTTLAFAHDQTDVILPWTDDLCQTYAQTYQQTLLDVLPELVWNLPNGALSQARWRYHDHLAERFVQAFCDTLGRWCEENGLIFTGHVMGEGTLAGQTRAVGEAMRCYRAFGIPGIDVLGEHKLEYSTAKQTQSAVRQQGSQGMLSELYGASGWDFDFRGYKLQGDWQAAMGVTVRVPHHGWYTMYGEPKRDYPGSIHDHAPWWTQYHLIEDHFARINTALTRGTPQVRVAVIHPIESCWIQYGPTDQSGAALEELENEFQGLIHTLVRGLIDFDFISESRLPALCPQGGFPLQVGQMAYDTVIVPALVTLRTSTLARLEDFAKAGGRVIFLGGCPRYVDAVRSDAVMPLYDAALHCAGAGAALVDLLRDVRELDVRLPGGGRADHLTYQLRLDGEDKWLFIATTRWQPSPDVDIPNQSIKFNVGQRYDTEVLRFEIQGEYALTLYDTLTGQTQPLPAQYRDGKTIFSRRWYMHDSLLLRLSPGRNDGESVIAPVREGSWRPFGTVPVTLDEPNVLLLDMAEFSLDGGSFEPQEEILRLENICRGRIGTMLRKRAIPQPYQMPEDTPTHRVTLRFTISSRIDVPDPLLALEDASLAQIRLNGQPVSNHTVGWYVDRGIRTVALPPLHTGENTLEITRPIGLRTVMEACYLLGDFGVSVQGTVKTITAPVRSLAFGSWTHQGLAFYSGNVTYHLSVTTGGGVFLRCPHYRGASLRVCVDGVDRGPIIFSPYELDLSDLAAGAHQIDITVFNTRQNTFAPLHHLGSIPFCQGPDSYRATGDLWCYEYALRDKGLLSAPRLYPSKP